MISRFSKRKFSTNVSDRLIPCHVGTTFWLMWLMNFRTRGLPLPGCFWAFPVAGRHLLSRAAPIAPAKRASGAVLTSARSAADNLRTIKGLSQKPPVRK